MWWIFINIHSKAHVLIMWLISVRLINDVCLRLECSHFKLICVQKRSKAPGSAGMVPWFWRLRLSVPADPPPPHARPSEELSHVWPVSALRAATHSCSQLIWAWGGHWFPYWMMAGLVVRDHRSVSSASLAGRPRLCCRQKLSQEFLEVKSHLSTEYCRNISI